MTKHDFQLELITPCFCAGAEPEKQAEIRAPSIRGQLRWWFRTLGGFKSLGANSMPVREQENLIFGTTAGNSGQAGKLIVRVSLAAGQSLTTSLASDEDAKSHGYLLFPLRNKTRKKSALPAFTLHLLWRGDNALGPDISALGTIFGHFGSLGFRGRRAMGALAHSAQPMGITDALNCFNQPQDLQVYKINTRCDESGSCITELANWLKRWRQHGRSPNLMTNEPGFGYARRDHNEGLEVLTGQKTANDPPGHPAKGSSGETFRAALGLPIIQYFSSQPKGQNKVNWEFGTGKAKGRFASPVLLRPHRDAQQRWHALVIFVDAHQWPAGRPVYVNSEKRTVSLELYEAMKKDPALKPFQ